MYVAPIQLTPPPHEEVGKDVGPQERRHDRESRRHIRQSSARGLRARAIGVNSSKHGTRDVPVQKSEGNMKLGKQSGCTFCSSQSQQ